LKSSLVDEVVINGFVINLNLLWADWWEWGVLAVEELVEFLSVILLEETTEGPDQAVDEKSFEGLFIDLLSSLNVTYKESLHKVKKMVNSAKLWARHNEVIALVKLGVSVWGFNIFLGEFFHPSGLIRVAVSLDFNSILAPGINEWSPEEISVRYIDNTASRYSSWGGIVQVFDLESHLGGIRHWNSLSISKSKNSVIIKYCVQVLNPNGIYWAITNDPRSMFVGFGVTFQPDLGENTRDPLTSDVVHDTVHLLTSDGFWVQSIKLMNLSLTESISKSVHNSGLTTSDRSDNHESMTHKGSFIKLNNLNEPIFNFKEVVFLKESSNGSLDLLIDFLWNVLLLWENILQQL
jgi:hypothetical protein